MDWLHPKRKREIERQCAIEVTEAQAVDEQATRTLEKIAVQERDTRDTVRSLTKVGLENNFIEALRVVLGGVPR